MTDPEVKVRMRDGWAVFDGSAQHSGGAVLTVPSATAAQWEAAGLVDRLPEPKRRTRR